MKDTLKQAGRILRIRFNHWAMSDNQRNAYEIISQKPQVDTKNLTAVFQIPAGVSDKQAEKALKLIQLEYGDDWKITGVRRPQ